MYFKNLSTFVCAHERVRVCFVTAHYKYWRHPMGLKYPSSYANLAPVLCRILHPCQIMHPLVEIATWLPNPNPTPNPNPSPTPTPKPTNTRGCIIWQGAKFGTTPGLGQLS